MKKKCVFLDRDGVINVDNVNYTYKVEEFKIIDGVIPALKLLKDAGYLLIIVTNQSGIAKGIYQHEDVFKCHNYFDEQSGKLIDEYFYSPYHQTISESLSRKPGTLMFEKAIAKYNIDIEHSWMVGDRERDITPANKLNISTILIEEFSDTETKAQYKVHSLLEAAQLILKGKA